jgi:hypothetical protein
MLANERHSYYAGYDADTFEWKSGLFAHPDGYSAQYGSYGPFDLKPDRTVYDEAFRHEDWPTSNQLGRILEKPMTFAVSSYGMAVYRAYQQEEGMNIVMLDDRVFLGGTNLMDVMEEAAHIAMDEGRTEDTPPFLRGIVSAAYTANFADETLVKYQDVFMRTERHDMIREYVEQICRNTVKGPEGAWQRLKSLAHAVQALPTASRRVHFASEDAGLSDLHKQILLEDIGHAWVRKSMPIAEIDFLP